MDLAETPSREMIAHLAFVDHGRDSLQLASDGPLAGLDFAVKDLIDVAGYRSGWGNPDRLRDTPPAIATAPAVLVPLMAGARMAGKTATDELACGMFGMNPHFGIPINPAAPDRVPGGSSSGSASAVAAGLADFALGSDTGGSIRVPASFCGLYGLRTTHGRVSVAGVMPMAPSFDTIGWLTRDIAMMKRVSACYFGTIEPAAAPRLMIARDAFDIPEHGIGAALLPIAKGLGVSTEITLYEEGVQFWLETFRPLQLHDLYATLGAFAAEPGRRLSQAVAERFALAATVKAEAVAAAMPRREALTDRLLALLGDDGIIILPTVHDLPPLRDAPVSAQIAFREKTLALTAVASLTRLPQLAIPATTFEGCPIGLSLIGGPRSEKRLIAFAETMGDLTRKAGV
ncbi:amidase [Mesorhizobium sp. BR1-1-16]|uniref:amidase n=1 Tax=Mesorhizobium sp. BR1-1-16 TaxID=2876653 RepID=UPI001CD01CA8|nr:amidase [Mesorhizobium sp. BR1-1-16]MBZ9935732.1 amidase [Mesorhizobium sp. BR1-1-16]